MQDRNYGVGPFGGGRISRRGLLRRAGIGGAGLLGAALVGCGGEDEPEADTPDPGGSSTPTGGTSTGSATATAEAGTPKTGGTLTRTAPQDVVHWDQHLQTIAGGTTTTLNYNNISLVQYDHDDPNYRNGSVKVAPYAADTWETPDPLTYTFTLHPGIKWDAREPTSGRELVADDVKYTFERFYGSEFLQGVSPQPAPQSIEVIDDHTVKFTLQQPNSQWLSLIANGNFVIYAHEVEDTFGDFKVGANNRGAGPFILEEHTPGSRIVFKRNPDYFREGRPYIDELVILIGLNDEAALSAFRSGQVDIYDVNPPQLDSVRTAVPDATFLEQAGCCAPAIFHRMDMAPTSDLRFRQAMSKSFDRKAWIDSLYRGYGEAPYSPFTSLWTDYTIPESNLSETSRANYEYDPEESVKLLAAMGAPDGFGAPADMNMYPGAVYEQSVQLVMDFLAKVGIETTLVTKDYGAYIASTYRGDFTGLGWGPAGAFSPAEVMSKWIPGSAGRNQNHIDDPVVNDLIEKFNAAESDEEAIEIAWQVQDRSADQLLWIMGSYQHTFHTWQPWLKNYDGKQDTGYNEASQVEQVWVDRA